MTVWCFILARCPDDRLLLHQVVDMCLAVIRCAVENGTFVHVNNYVSKASPS